MLLDRIKSVQHALRAYGVQDMTLNVMPPVRASTLVQIEERLQHALPLGLRQVFESEAAGLKFQWTIEALAPQCRRGCAWLLTPREIVDAYNMHVSIVLEAKHDCLDRDSEGYEALIRDWPNWIPLFRFPSGDFFCLDTAAGLQNPPVVFLEHDVMDQGPNLHGLHMADSFEDLILAWSDVFFAEIHDWSAALIDGRISGRAAIFAPLAKFIKRG